MSYVTFADVVHPSISFSKEQESEEIVLRLIDTAWFQRLRDISQTANTRLVYMFSEHSRFGHCVGVAYLANQLMDKLARSWDKEISQYRTAVSVAALLHDIGHLAPGSHTAYRTWFPDCSDMHETISRRIIADSPEIRSILDEYSSTLIDQVLDILKEDPKTPKWTWQLLSGGGWNVDRGNWCIVDSILAGVTYGRYNIDALTDSLEITADGELAIRDNRLDAMMHFALSRHAMYRQIYQHRVLLAADTVNFAITARARDLGDNLDFADSHMRKVLSSDSPADLSLEDLFVMRESWWKYHLMQWSSDSDQILADLSNRLLQRRIFKTIRVRADDNIEQLSEEIEKSVINSGFNPKYYQHHLTHTYMHRGDDRQSLLVMHDDGSTTSLKEAEPLFDALLQETEIYNKSWIAVPEEVKQRLGRTR